MIGIGEKIQIELFDLPESVMTQIKDLSSVQRATYDEKTLDIFCANGGNSLSTVLQVLHGNDIAFGKVYSETPTLNDVFLELTGKELRD